MPRRHAWRALVCIVVALVAVTTRASAQRTADSAARPPGSPVVLGADTLFRLYGSLGPFTDSLRAATASERLRQFAITPSRVNAAVRVVDRGSYSEIAAGQTVLLTVLDTDAQPLGRTRASVAGEYAAAVQSAVRSMAATLTARSLLADALEALAATAALILVLWALAWATRRLHARIDRLRELHFPALRIQELEILSAGGLATFLGRLLRAVRVVLVLLALYFYVPLVLSFFPWTAPVSRRVVGYAVQPFVAAGAAVVAYLPSLFYLAAGIIITRYLLAFLRLVFDALGSGAITVRGFYPDWADPTYKIVRVLVLAFAVTVLYPFLPGASSDAFKGVSIFLGVLLSFGSSTAIGNVVAGVVLTYTRAFQLGDRVQIGDTVGDVTEKTLLVTRVRTIKNVAVTVPNATVLSSHVINYSTLAAEHGLILHTAVTIGYDTPWPRVHELLIAAALRTEHLRPEPPPFVLQTSLDDSYVSYEINAYTDAPVLMADTYSRLHERIQETFNAAGVEIMSPHYAALRDGNRVTIPGSTRSVSSREIMQSQRLPQ
ncbi:MAG TPA: mechanosensitive ion channel family protein [Gemmatimonadaceae bacterium]|nr:mechanosensitive ion channel family protein [Gemmatimonadaceae bacterium]